MPKNPYCQTCTRARMTRAPARRARGVPLHREHVKEFGDEISIDHVILGAPEQGSTALVVRDLATMWSDCVPLPHKTADAAYRGLRRIFGRTRIRTVHSDDAPELEKAPKDLGVLHDAGTPGRHNSNAYGLC